MENCNNYYCQLSLQSIETFFEPADEYLIFKIKDITQNLTVALYYHSMYVYTVADPGGDPHGAKEPPFGLDLVLKSIDDRLNGTTLSG